MNSMWQILERDTSAPWDISPFEGQAYYHPDPDFGPFYGVHDQGETGSRWVGPRPLCIVHIREPLGAQTPSYDFLLPGSWSPGSQELEMIRRDSPTWRRPNQESGFYRLACHLLERDSKSLSTGSIGPFRPWSIVHGAWSILNLFGSYSKSRS